MFIDFKDNFEKQRNNNCYRILKQHIITIILYQFMNKEKRHITLPIMSFIIGLRARKLFPYPLKRKGLNI